MGDVMLNSQYNLWVEFPVDASCLKSFVVWSRDSNLVSEPFQHFIYTNNSVLPISTSMSPLSNPKPAVNIVHLILIDSIEAKHSRPCPQQDSLNRNVIKKIIKDWTS